LAAEQVAVEDLLDVAGLHADVQDVYSNSISSTSNTSIPFGAPAAPL
jgi:hypothetical protein